MQAQMGAVICDGTLFGGADMTYADLSHAVLKDCDMTNLTLFRTNLHNLHDSGSLWQGSDKSQTLGTDEKRLAAEQWKPK